MGTRARFGDEEDESLPGRTSEAPSIEVAADFTGIYRILMSRDGIREKTVSSAITKVPAEMTVPHGFGKKRLRVGDNYGRNTSLLLLRVIKS